MYKKNACKKVSLEKEMLYVELCLHFLSNSALTPNSADQKLMWYTLSGWRFRNSLLLLECICQGSLAWLIIVVFLTTQTIIPWGMHYVPFSPHHYISSDVWVLNMPLSSGYLSGCLVSLTLNDFFLWIHLKKFF